ncbi:hypothetical protein DPX16_7465 [Anabarilius grahami]|uniref:Uncharacterized protein n=1 Tax=Anabarilius grahami TaxID=495550 RepID=A0A3N0YK38_ANAGA|nr:hypothetical protein DPX16_7465 [Anabarilius grahami]
MRDVWALALRGTYAVALKWLKGTRHIRTAVMKGTSGAKPVTGTSGSVGRDRGDLKRQWPSQGPQEALDKTGTSGGNGRGRDLK